MAHERFMVIQQKPSDNTTRVIEGKVVGLREVTFPMDVTLEWDPKEEAWGFHSEKHAPPQRRS